MIKKRKHIRLKEYDYSLEGSYFVTICTKNREHFFGEIVNGELRLNGIGNIAKNCWQELEQHFSNIMLDEFVIMPNHVHGIIIISEKPRRDVQLNIPTEDYFSKISPKPHSLGVIIRTYKAAVTTICKQNSYDDFQWQKGYYAHIIRNEKSLYRIREYIRTNPERWIWDKENTLYQGMDEFDRWLNEEGTQNIKIQRML
ncbi:MAG: transposase [Bacteroidota bacterium]|nr:transposase [Bacteroidota bacterium]